MLFRKVGRHLQSTLQLTKTLRNKAVETFMNVKYMQNGLRPATKTFIEATHISNHNSKFDGGVTKIVAIKPTGLVAPTTGTFVLPKTQAAVLINQADGNPRTLEKLRGLDSDVLGSNPVRLDIIKPDRSDMQ